jgi:type IV pilus assembly protein PilZ
VDCSTANNTFLYASITNVSVLGIFVSTESPLPIGTLVTLRFCPPKQEAFSLSGRVQWVNPLRDEPGNNPNPGMGIRFVDLLDGDTERLEEIVKTIAYVRDDVLNSTN